jgi:hypothetical protein
MSIEDSFKYKVWRVLQKIKKYYILNDTYLPIHYVIRLFPILNNYFTSQDECDLLKSLEVSKAIHIYKWRIQENVSFVVYLDILQPKFNEIYKEYELFQQFYNYQISQKNFNNIEDQEFSYNLNNQYNLCFPLYFLRQETKRLEVVLRHFLKAGAIGHVDYQYLVTFNKMMRKLISNAIDNQRIGNQKEKFNNYKEYRKKDKKFRKPFDKNKVITNVTENIDKEPIKEKQSLPITGKIEVSGLSEGLKALRVKEPTTTGPKFPFKIPAGTHWNNIIIKFLDDEHVEIHVKRLKHKTDFKEMGMIGKGKIPEPSEQWLFMKVLAKCQGEITIKDPEAKEKYKKQKQTLTETLRNYFSIDYDPFYPYHSCPEKGGNSYKIKLLLIPPFEKEVRPIIDDEEFDPLGIKEYLSETFRT